MQKRHNAFATVLLALAATGLSTAAEARPCIPGTGSTDTSTCIGAGALAKNTTGDRNTAIGLNAMNSNTTGRVNTAIGSGALFNNTTGHSNTASGHGALFANTQGQNNTATGVGALGSNTTGSANTANGAFALNGNTTGSDNTASGTSALSRNTTGRFNTAHGKNALTQNITGFNNTASGFGALASNVTGGSNTAHGFGALFINSTGSNNTAVGFRAGALQNTGSNNIALGFEAGVNLSTGSNNIIIGNTGTVADQNTIRIGSQGTHVRTFITGIRGTRVTAGQAVMVDANNQLGVISSSARYKEDIQPMGDASSPLMQLRPVTFRYKLPEADGSKPIQYGLIAEEVEQAMPDLVIYNNDGTPESVAYQLLPSLLLNEYQKQGRELAEAKAKLEVMDTELAALKLAMSRLAAAPSAVQLAASKP